MGNTAALVYEAIERNDSPLPVLTAVGTNLTQLAGRPGVLDDYSSPATAPSCARWYAAPGPAVPPSNNSPAKKTSMTRTGRIWTAPLDAAVWHHQLLQSPSWAATAYRLVRY